MEMLRIQISMVNFSLDMHKFNGHLKMELKCLTTLEENANKTIDNINKVPSSVIVIRFAH